MPKQGFGADDSMRKRYNVATSRARDQLWVVHSLDVGNDLKEGDLRRDLIAYAEDPSALQEKIEEIKKKSESVFESSVAIALVARGYDIVQQWEVGSFRIDMVACHEGGKVAIECDGERWHSGDAKIREDMERQAILERLGWRFIRIRGSEYYQDPEAAIERVCGELMKQGIDPAGYESALGSQNHGPSDLLQRVLARAQELSFGITDDDAALVEDNDGSGFVEVIAEDYASEPDPVFDDEAIEHTPEVDVPCNARHSDARPDSNPQDGGSEDATPACNASPAPCPSIGSRAFDVPTDAAHSASRQIAASWMVPDKIVRKGYVAAALSPMQVEPTDYISRNLQDVICSRMEKVLEVEQPIEKQKLFNLVRGSMGIGRSGRDIQFRNESILRKIDHRTTQFKGREFIWMSDTDPDGLNSYRFNHDGIDRKAHEVPYEEIRLAIVDVVKSRGICKDEEIIREAATQFGFSRIGSNVRKVFSTAISMAVYEGVLEKLRQNGYSLNKCCVKTQFEQAELTLF